MNSSSLTKRDFLKAGPVALASSALFAQRRPPRVYPKLGIMCRCTEKNIDFAVQTGCESMQVHAMPGSTLDITKVSAEDATRALEKARAAGITISAYNCSFNHLDLRPEVRESNQTFFRKLIPFASETGVPVIGAQTGLIKDAKLEANVEEIKRVFTPYIEQAEKHNVKIALENYPGFNLATTPENFERIFDLFPSRALGLEYDPSHLVRQFIDPIAPARQFGDRIYHVHAKDTEIIQPTLQKRGIHGEGWWRYRIPGCGRINWAELITTLLEANYSGGIDVEHEDRLYGSGSGPGPDIPEPMKEGYRLGLRHLSQFIPSKARGVA